MGEVKMKNMLLFALGVVLSLSASAAPVVSDVSVHQKWSDSKLVITYALSGGDAIVTADVLTNGVSVGDVSLRTMTGDVNRKVQEGTKRKIVWCPPAGWAGDASSLNISARLRSWTEQEPPDYMVIALDGSKTRSYYVSEDALPLGIESDEYRTNSLVMRLVHAAGETFRMGAPRDELGANVVSIYNDGMRITQLSDDYYLGVFEVTQAQYVKVAGGTSFAVFSNADVAATRPMDSVRWADNLMDSKWPNDDESIAYQSSSTKFFGKLRALTGFGVRLALPTEAQWEYACRAGSTAALYDGSSMSTNELGVCAALDALGRYARNGGLVNGKTDPDFTTCGTDVGTARVGSYAPNAWGFYDMLGNVAELCMDMFNYYEAGILVDPVGPTQDSQGYSNNRALRGGSWKSEATRCRCASRTTSQMWVKSSDTGFRICYTIR